MGDAHPAGRWVAARTRLRNQGLRLWGEAQNSLLGRIVQALLQVNLRDRALTLAGQAFIALVPLLIVVAMLVGSSGGKAVADWFVSRFGLTGAAADAVTALFARPPSAVGSVGILGFLLLLWSVLSFARSVQRTYELAWGLPAAGQRGAVRGVTGAFVLLVSLGGVAYVSSLVADAVGRSLVYLLQIPLAVPGWWLASRLLLNRRISWSELLPGAVVSATAMALAALAGSIWVPILVERDIGRYGVIGAATALITWLTALSLVVVASAVVGAQVAPYLSRRDQGLGPGRGESR